MCELMGLSFAKPISADFSIREFALRSEENADGWGLGWYPDQSLAVEKAIQNVKEALVLGAILAGAVLLLFLRDFLYSSFIFIYFMMICNYDSFLT